MTNMNKKFVSLFLFLAAPLLLWAKPITRQQAAAQATAFLLQKGKLLDATVVALPLSVEASIQALTSSPLTSSPSTSSETGTAPGTGVQRLNASAPACEPFYIFNTDGGRGFVILSGDDTLVPVLGYSDAGAFDNANLPDNFASFLQAYADLILRYQQEMEESELGNSGTRELQNSGNPEIHSTLAPFTEYAEAIEPLLQTKWNQGTPYNNQCPVINGSLPPSGCVATAMAQCMYYFRWPQGDISQPIPAHTFTCDDVQYTMDELPVTSFEWSKMKTTYSSDKSEQYVSKLMLYVGQSIKMGYTLGGSGASMGNACNALKKYYGYWAKHIHRSDMSIAEWEGMFLNELQNKRPIFMAGYSTSAGHSFVCDGYDGGGLFHINWGWGGGSDGYFRLSILNPGDNSGWGATPTSDGYGMGTEAIIGMCHAEDAPVGDDPQYLNLGSLSLDGTKVSYTIWNTACSEEHTFEHGIATVDEDGNFTFLNATRATCTLASGWGYTSPREVDVKASLKGNATYKLVAVSRVQGTTTWYQSYKNQYIDLQLSTLKRVLSSTVHPVRLLARSDISIIGNNFVGQEQWVKLDAYNGGDELNVEPYLFASTTQDKGKSVCHGPLILAEGGHEEVLFPWTPDSIGTYNLWVTWDSEGKNVISRYTAEVTKSRTLSTTTPAATFYPNTSYGGSGKKLPEGEYYLTNLKAYGINNDDIESLKVLPGYIVKMYENDLFHGDTISYTGNVNALKTWANVCSSLKISCCGTPDMDGLYTFCSLRGRLMMDVTGTTAGSQVCVADTTMQATQFFQLQHVADGIYHIRNEGSDLYLTMPADSLKSGAHAHLDVLHASGDEGYDARAQQFILVRVGELYQLVSRLSGRVLDVTTVTPQPGTPIVIKDNTSQVTSKWMLTPVPTGVDEVELGDSGTRVLQKSRNPEIHYNLAGQRVGDGYRGIVIRHGKKIIKQ